jgi:4-hydroxy-2-oxoheptanedioate aldolase
LSFDPALLPKSLTLGLSLRERLSRRDVVTGAWCTLPHPSVIELMARLDFDFLLLDSEHSAIGLGDLGALLPACELHDAPAIFRPRSHCAAEG